MKKNAINIIFAVTDEQHHVYEELSKHIEGSSSGILSQDSDNVVELVRDQYNVSSIYTITIACSSILSWIKFYAFSSNTAFILNTY